MRCGHLFLVFMGLLGMVPTAKGAKRTMQTQANVPLEITLKAGRHYGDAAHQVTVDVIFTDSNNRKRRVPAFWGGGNLWKVRYASPLVGTHWFVSDCSERRDKGLHGISGKVFIKPYAGTNPLFKHGPLRVASNRRYLEHANGTPFFWLGDTWWMGLCHRLRWPDEFMTLATNRKAKGFNVIQIVAGLYPDMPPFDPRGANEAGFPWEPDFARLRPEYFDAADKRIQYLVEQGFTPCIVGAWGYFVPLMGVEKAKQHWRNLIARYGALPVVWCVAGEANLPYYQAKGFPYDDREQVKGWTQVARYVRENDPFHRPLTIHPTGIGRLSARHAIDDVSLLDIDMLQTPHGQREAVPPTVRTMRESHADQPVLPVINGEASYEMLNDSIPARWPRAMFWICMMNGAAGHTYGANGIWQANRKGQPHGPSPTFGSPPTGYGAIPWDEAMHLPGSGQIGLGKKLLAQYPWHKFEPHPEWASYAIQPVLSFEGCQWIWFPEGNPAQNAPAEKRFFRRAFRLPEGKTVKSARLRISVDDKFSARLNGQIIGGFDNWRTGQQFDIARLLQPGANVLAVEAENLPAPAANPAGLIARLQIQFTDGGTTEVVSDGSWSCFKNANAGWDASPIDSETNNRAMVVEKYGEAPWGRIDDLLNDHGYQPQVAGIPGVVRVIYVLESRPIVVSNLEKNASYQSSYFDPATGTRSEPMPLRTDQTGQWTCAPLITQEHDWVLILENK
jgi:hypothetical protein